MSLIKKTVTSLVLIAVVSAGITFAVRANSASDADARKLQVTATFYPLYEFAKQVGGDKVQVTTITPNGVEPHDYEPSPKALVQAQKADVFIYNGGTFEPWTDDFVTDYKYTAIKASSTITLKQGEAHDHDHTDEEHHAHDGTEHAREPIADPHFWLDPVLAQQILNTIRDGLSKADPANKALYARNAAAYNTKLAALDREFTTGLANCKLDTIITSHSAFTYVAERYGFSVEPIAGLSPEQEPTPARLADLSEHMRAENISHVFFERLVSPQLAATIARETGAKTLVLDPIEGLTNDDQKQGIHYLDIQRENLANLRTALACQ